ncbi:tyrosine-type recombinase/integrase [Alteribacillus sp. JSM 102045]|uniref:tyrosine-type recombinase/integrase n=1 Tax=Alteribacillus sp. JSM 102045 TaxID=1562101 RepID=UPI0035BFE7C0
MVTFRGATYLFSPHGKKYSDLVKMEQSISPHKLRLFLFTWLKKKGIDDALIQPYSGHSNRQSLEVYSKLAITETQDGYNQVIDDFPVQSPENHTSNLSKLLCGLTDSCWFYPYLDETTGNILNHDFSLIIVIPSIDFHRDPVC